MQVRHAVALHVDVGWVAIYYVAGALLSSAAGSPKASSGAASVVQHSCYSALCSADTWASVEPLLTTWRLLCCPVRWIHPSPPDAEVIPRLQLPFFRCLASQCGTVPP